MNSNTTQPRVALLGLGLMGSGMARQLLKAGFPLTVFNRSRQKALALAEAGARAAPTPLEAAAAAGVIVSMVADDNASRAVWLGEHGALAALTPGTVCIESSTLTVGWVRELAEAVSARGGEFLDAPVTGSKVHAQSGELNFFIGGSESTLKKVQPVFAAMSKTVTWVGPVGSGALLKLVNNFVCGVQIAAFSEAVALIERGGLDRAKALELLTNGASGSPMIKTIAARLAAADYTPNFPLRLMTKDLGYAIEEGAKLSVELATGAAALGDFQKALAAGLGDQDMAALAGHFRQAAAQK
jgi:3-hydroxyisobutyrate dehydrogenase